jgi:hypothetical protein
VKRATNSWRRESHHLLIIVRRINKLSRTAVATLYIRMHSRVAVIDQPFVFAPFIYLECVLLFDASMESLDDSAGSQAGSRAARAALQSSERRRLLRNGIAAGPILMSIASRPVLAQTACVSPSAMGSIATSGQHAVSMCSGLTPEQWAAIATQWPSPYVGQGETTINVASAPPAPAPSAPSSTITTYRSGATHGVTIGSRQVPDHRLSTTVVAANPALAAPAPVTTATSSAAPTATTTTTTSSYTPFANHGVTIGSRQMPTYSWRTPTAAPAPTAPPPPSITQASTQPGTPFHCSTTGFGGSTYGAMSMLDVIGADSNGTGLGRYIVAALLNARAGRTPILGEFGVRSMWNDYVSRGYYEPTGGVQWGAAQIVAYLKTTMG